MYRLVVVGNGSGAPALVLEVRRAAGSGLYYQFYMCCRGRGVFVSVKQNYHNTLRTNLNCNIVQDITNSTYIIQDSLWKKSYA